MFSKNLSTSLLQNRPLTVVIPALNEAATIRAVVKLAKRSAHVARVLVIDDGSIDGTPQIARAAGARVITSTMLGKGASMEDGLREARTDLIAYLDGDLRDLDPDSIDNLIAPLLADEADFVKARFARASGRVTALTAKPLLRSYFPELNFLTQPLSGIVAARTSLLRQLQFENDFGVDIGLLLDAYLAGARIVQVDIGTLINRNHPLEQLSEMASQVCRALFERAARAGRLRLSFVRETREAERLQGLTLNGFLERVSSHSKLALFDMDGVLLNGRFVLSLAAATNREAGLAALLDNFTIHPTDRTKRIATLFKGVSRETFERAAREIPLMPGAIETIVALRKAGYRVGVVTDSYHFAADIVRRRVFADFAFAHFMRFQNGRASGRINLCPAMIHPRGCTEHDHCKVNVLHHLRDRHHFDFSQILAVGDGENDICMLKAAGTSVAFQPKSARVQTAAKFTAHTFTDILQSCSITPECTHPGRQHSRRRYRPASRATSP